MEKQFRLGICTGPDQIAAAAEAGFDYVEMDLNRIMRMDEDAYVRMADTMDRNGIYAEVVCGMLPEDLPVVGTNVSAHRQHEALARSFETARALGAEIIIFDSEKMRRLPKDFDPAMAWRQLGNLIRIIQGYCADYDLRAGLLPIRRSASDLMNHISEAALISAMLRLDRIGVAASRYNMAMESESNLALRNAGSLLWHMRISNALGNRLPAEHDGEDYSGLFSALLDCGYSGRVSCEGSCTDFARDAKAAYEHLKRFSESC